jgi:uncharacterized protein YdeI (YjbR/CyaY-like superfamily)
MKPHDVQSYISLSPAYAQPILEKIRETVHVACPGIREQLKWSFPHFVYNGSSLCYMAAFKHHCAFGFWLAEYMQDPAGIFIQDDKKSAMGNFGKITSIENLPATQHLVAYLHSAMELIDMGVKIKKPTPSKTSTETKIHEDFANALDSNTAAKEQFYSMTASCQKEYAHWIAEAKRAETRQKRIASALEWIAEGKRRDWKYEKS